MKRLSSFGVRFGLCLFFASFFPTRAADPVLLGKYPSYPPMATGGEVSVAEDRAYAAAGTAGFAIVDISDLQNPRRIGGYDTAGHVLDIEVVGSTAFVADDAGGLLILDVSNAANVTVISSVPTIRAAALHWISASLLYVADPTAGLRVVNIVDLQSPQVVATVPITSAISVAASGNLALVGTENAGVKVLTTTDPANPSLAGTFPRRNSGFTKVAIRGNVGYGLERSDGITTFNLANPQAPTLMGNYDEGLMRNLAFRGDYALVGSTPGGMLVIDVTDPFLPRKVGANTEDLHVYGVAVTGNHALVATGFGLNVVNLTAPAAPTFVASAETLYFSDAVAVSGNLLVSVGSNFRVFDVSDPANPILLGKTDTGSGAGDLDDDVKISGTTAYVAAGRRGLIVVDISNPAAPTVQRTIRDVAQLQPPFETARLTPNKIDVQGNRIYGADGIWGFWIIDVTVPDAPVLIGERDLGGTSSVIGDGNYVYLGAQSSVLVVDISNPFLPEFRAIYGHNGMQTTGLHLVGTKLYAAAAEVGLEIIDVTNPATPVRLGGYDSPSFAHDVAVIANRAYVADQFGGLLVLDVSNPASPRRLGGVPATAPGVAYSVAFANDLVYVAAGNSGVQIFGGAPAELAIQTVETGTLLTLQGEADRDYRVQHTGSLNNGTTWTDMGIFRLQSETQTIPDPATGQEARFYRATALP